MKSVTLIRDLPFPQDRVWRALSTGALMAEWLLPNDFQPVAGHRFTLRSPAPPSSAWDGLIQAEVLTVDPPNRLSYSWNTTGDPWATVTTTVTFILTATPTGTRLDFTQSGFRDDQPQNYAGARYGWTMFLDRLDARLAKET